MKTYELMTIFKPNLDAEEVDKVIEKINSVITEFGGKVVEYQEEKSTIEIRRKRCFYR